MPFVFERDLCGVGHLNQDARDYASLQRCRAVPITTGSKEMPDARKRGHPSSGTGMNGCLCLLVPHLANSIPENVF